MPVDAGDSGIRPARGGPGSRSGRRAAGASAGGKAAIAAAPEIAQAGAAATAGEGSEATPDGPAARIPAAERRRGALVLVGIWRSVLRDLALAGRGATGSIRDLELLDDLGAAAASVSPGQAGELLRDLDLAGERLEGNVSPELVLDVLALRWAADTGGA